MGIKTSILLWTVLLCVLTGTARAQVSMHFPLPELIDRSDIICVGGVMGAMVDRRKDNSMASVTASVGVLRALKKPLPTAHFNLLLGAWPAGTEPAELPANGYYLLFLRGDTKDTAFSLFNTPADSLIFLGDTLPEAIPARLSPFRISALLVARALAHTSPDRRPWLLGMIQEAVSIVIPQNPDTKRLAARLSEGHGAREFFASQIIPLITPYTHDPDPVVRGAAQKIIDDTL